MLASLKKRNTYDLIWILWRTDFKLKYNDSVLGFIWVLIKPFSVFLILYVFLTNIFPSPVEHFVIYLLIGNVFISFWTEGTNLGLDSLLSRAGLITKVNFPRYTVLISSTSIALVNFLINSIIVFIFVFVNGLKPRIMDVLWYFLCSAILYMIMITVSMFLSILYVRFRDLKQIWELFTQLLFWMTPVFYSYQALASKNEIFELILYWLNPVSVLLISAREALMRNEITLQFNVFAVMSLFLVLFGIGYTFYKKQIKKIAEYF